jgi:hypothetical protein
MSRDRKSWKWRYNARAGRVKKINREIGDEQKDVRQ